MTSMSADFTPWAPAWCAPKTNEPAPPKQKAKEGPRCVEQAKLKADTMIQGMVFKAGTTIEFYDNGKIKAGTLAQDTYIQGQLHKAGSQVSFPADEAAKKPATPIQGMVHSGFQGLLDKKSGFPIDIFYKNGEIKTVVAPYIPIEGIKYKAGMQDVVPEAPKVDAKSAK